MGVVLRHRALPFPPLPPFPSILPSLPSIPPFHSPPSPLLLPNLPSPSPFLEKFRLMGVGGFVDTAPFPSHLPPSPSLPFLPFHSSPSPLLLPNLPSPSPFLKEFPLMGLVLQTPRPSLPAFPPLPPFPSPLPTHSSLPFPPLSPLLLFKLPSPCPFPRGWGWFCRHRALPFPLSSSVPFPPSYPFLPSLPPFSPLLLPFPPLPPFPSVLPSLLSLPFLPSMPPFTSSSAQLTLPFPLPREVPTGGGGFVDTAPFPSTRPSRPISLSFGPSLPSLPFPPSLPPFHLFFFPTYPLLLPFPEKFLLMGVVL